MAKIIAVTGGANSGKTESIKELCARLNQPQPTSPKDVTLIIVHGNKKIGITSMGDIPSELKDNIDSLLSQGCDIIITACRTRGATTDIIFSYCQSHTVMWVAKTKAEGQTLRTTLRNRTVDHLLQII